MKRLALAVLLFQLAGCSALEADPARPPLPPVLVGAGKGHKVMIAPVALAPSFKPVDEDEGPRGTFKSDLAGIGEELRTALAPVFPDGVEVAPSDLATQDAIVRDAWRKGCDLLLVPRLERYDAVFTGNNGWWWPNAFFLYWYFWVPSFWIADEEYGIDVRLVYDVLGVRSEQPLPGFRNRPVEVSSLDAKQVTAAPGETPAAPVVALDDLDRGLDILGTYRPGKLDRDQWKKVTGGLDPYARRWLAAAVARDLGHELGHGTFSRLTPAEKTRALAAVHALIVGVGRTTATDECRYADMDALRVRAWIGPPDEEVAPIGSASLESARVAPAKNVALLIDGKAQIDAVRAELDGARARTRPEDTYVFYFAGRGVRLKGAGLAGLGLVLYGASSDEVRRAAAQSLPSQVLTLAELCKLLRAIPAHRKVVVIDAGFGGGPRSIGPAEEKDGRSDVRAALERELFAGDATGTAILAAPPGNGAYVLESERAGLLTHCLLDGLAACAGRALPTPAELERSLDRSVTAIAELEMMDAPQSPLVVTKEGGAPLFERSTR
jgi:hypothetical protein